MRSQEEIDAEIKALKECKQYAPARNTFDGDDNHAAIDAQIDYLRGKIDTTSEDFDDEYTQGEIDAIQEVMDWRDGRGSELPSSGWDAFKPKAATESK